MENKRHDSGAGSHFKNSPKEREFVVDSGASMHMLSKRDLSSDEMDSLRRSRIPTTVVRATGEVQTNEEAQVYVHDLDLFVTVQIVGDTPAVLSPGKLRDEQGYTYVWTSGQKPHLTRKERGSYARQILLFPVLSQDRQAPA